MDIHEAEFDDLTSLLELYTHLNNNTMPIVNETVEKLWKDMMNDENHHIIVGKVDGMVVSSCILLIVPNLTHGQEPYGIIENVVTHSDHQKKGYGAAILEYAKNIAISEGCYKISLMTGSKKESTLKFYEKAGYNSKDKTAFIQWFGTPPG